MPTLSANLVIALKIAGLSMVLLACMHMCLDRVFDWQKELIKLKPINRQIFIVHTVFLAGGILMLGISCLTAPEAMVSRSPLARMASASFALCWATRLACQFFVFRSEITGNGRLDKIIWLAGTGLWLFYTALFAIIFFHQVGVIQD